MWNRHPTSFRTRLLLGVLAPILLVQLAATAVELRDLRARYHEALVLEAALVASLVGESMVQPLWDFDLDQVQSLANRVVQEGSIASAVVIDPEGDLLARAEQGEFVQAEKNLTVTRALSFVSGETEEKLGDLVLSISTAGVDAVVAGMIFRKVVLSALILSLIGSALVIVLVRLSGPLLDLTRGIARLSGGNLESRMPWTDREDEIGDMARALDQLRLREAELAALRSQTDEMSRRERKRIRRALESTHDAILLADENQRVIYCNPRAKEFFRETQTGTLLKLSRSIDWKSAEVIHEAMQSQTNCLAEATTIIGDDHSIRNLLIRGGPILDEDARFLGTAVLATDRTEHARQTERVRFLSEHDSLTGLANRRVLEEALQKCIAERTEGSVLLGDLDNFKRINDTLGHPVGDGLLCHVAMLLRKIVPHHDLAVRLGGDEFAILARGQGCEVRLLRIGQELVERLAKPQPVDERTLYTGVSAGVSGIRNDDRSSSEVLRRADLALYEAKKAGRGRVELFRDEYQAIINRKSLIEIELRKALAQREIFPHFQMQTSTSDGRIVGFEALARWSHSSIGQIPPAEFIPIAEDSGLIEDLTTQILQRALSAAAQWKQIGFNGRVAVNISPAMFSGDLVELVEDCLLQTSCEASCVEIEITEAVVLSKGDHARKIIERLRSGGITVALDDFGMGYSSLSYLQNFPVDKIKIDRAFISRLPNSEETKAIVVAIADLGHALGMAVTGEGAETEEQRQCLRECRVDFLQGFLDGRPLTVAAATEALRREPKGIGQPRRSMSG